MDDIQRKHSDKVDLRNIYLSIENGKNRATTRAVPEEEQTKEDITYPCTILLDQSTRTGFSIWDSKKTLVTTGYVYKKDNCTLVEYKHILKEVIEFLIEKYNITTAIHEEVFGGENFHTVETLLYIKHMVVDLEHTLEGFKVYGFHNKIWKKHLAKPKPFKFGTTAVEKKEVRKYVEQYYPLLFLDASCSLITEDMADSIGMGIGLILNQKLKGNMLNLVQFNKKLPFHSKIVNKADNEDWETVIGKMNKPFRDAYGVSKSMEIELTKSKKLDDQIRRVLTHIDCVAYVKIDKSYRDWGLILLENNIKPSDLEEDKSFWIVTCRKKRK